MLNEIAGPPLDSFRGFQWPSWTCDIPHRIRRKGEPIQHSRLGAGPTDDSHIRVTRGFFSFGSRPYLEIKTQKNAARSVASNEEAAQSIPYDH